MKELNQKLLYQVVESNRNIIDEFRKVKILITREDGVAVYSDAQMIKNDHSTGVLVTGLWSAANALSDVLDMEKDKNYISFGVSSQGIHLLPLNLSEKPYVFCVLYDDIVNPSKLKFKCRLLNLAIESNYSKKDCDIDKVDKGKRRTKALFKNITDEEIDNLFTL